MLPKVIVHNLISVDGCFTGFEADLETYYSVAAGFGADMCLIGSGTMTGAGEENVAEEPADFIKPDPATRPHAGYCVVVDSRGICRNLHLFRRADYCKDVVVLVSATTPESHLQYLQERNYDYIIVGNDHVDYRKALEILYEKYHCRTLRVDSGGTLVSILIQQGLVNEISLIVAPLLTGNAQPALFGKLNLTKNINLKFVKSEPLSDGQLWITYQL